MLSSGSDADDGPTLVPSGDTSDGSVKREAAAPARARALAPAPPLAHAPTLPARGLASPPGDGFTLAYYVRLFGGDEERARAALAADSAAAAARSAEAPPPPPPPAPSASDEACAAADRPARTAAFAAAAARSAERRPAPARRSRAAAPDDDAPHRGGSALPGAEAATDLPDEPAPADRRALPAAPQPPEILMQLLPYQLEFLSWALAQERTDVKGGLLADEMGMGKVGGERGAGEGEREKKNTQHPPSSLISP